MNISAIKFGMAATWVNPKVKPLPPSNDKEVFLEDVERTKGNETAKGNVKVDGKHLGLGKAILKAKTNLDEALAEEKPAARAALQQLQVQLHQALKETPQKHKPLTRSELKAVAKAAGATGIDLPASLAPKSKTIGKGAKVPKPGDSGELTLRDE